MWRVQNGFYGNSEGFLFEFMEKDGNFEGNEKKNIKNGDITDIAKYDNTQDQQLQVRFYKWTGENSYFMHSSANAFGVGGG